MIVKAMRGFFGDEGQVRRGQILDVTDYRAAALLKKGLVSEVQGKVASPSSAGPTGKGKPPSSSPAGRQRRKRASS